MLGAKEREMEKEKKEILHFSYHQHPLSPVEIHGEEECAGCGKNFSIEEVAYGCSKKCGTKIIFHEECVELIPRKIRHPMHPEHILIQKNNIYWRAECAVCEREVGWFGYSCTSVCRFAIHWGCAPISGTVDVVDDDNEEAEKQSIKRHPGHPEHELRWLKSRHSFRCDACGTIQNGVSSSYICSICQYWIHESCASLPAMKLREDLHHHPLSLTFHLPKKFLKSGHKCDICSKNLFLKHWAYHCEICSYAVHIKCVINASMDNDDEGVFQFPVSDVSEELIRTFVVRQKRVIPHDNEIINGKYKFHNRHHQLSLISLEEHNDDDDDDDDELICDGCVTPIYQKKKQISSSFSSLPNSHKYYSCGECKYFLHFACFHLPNELPSHPFHQEYCNHKPILQSLPKLSLEWTKCDICDLSMNGLYYGCTECNFKADIKCTSLPNVIKHAGHPQHHHYLKLVMESIRGVYGLCGACGGYINAAFHKFYRCESCEFSLHCKCALLPAANKHRWDKHPLSVLIYGANINHLEGELHCGYCEEEMNPKSWMYHCGECDLSFHPDCFPTTSGEYRNIKFGNKYVNATCHPHPLIYQVITTKPRCDLCRIYVYGERGVQCASCNFVMCLYPCFGSRRDAVQAID